MLQIIVKLQEVVLQVESKILWQYMVFLSWFVCVAFCFLWITPHPEVSLEKSWNKRLTMSILCIFCFAEMQFTTVNKVHFPHLLQSWQVNTKIICLITSKPGVIQLFWCGKFCSGHQWKYSYSTPLASEH